MAEEIRLSKSFIETELPQKQMSSMPGAIGRARAICRRSSGRSRKDLH